MASPVQTPNQKFTLADWCVTEEKIVEAVERIIAVANPIKIIAFGSRARGDFRPESDLDLAVMFEQLDPSQPRPINRATLRDIVMPIDLLAFDTERYDLFRTSPNSVYYGIEHEGITLYDRNHDKSANRIAVKKLV